MSIIGDRHFPQFNIWPTGKKIGFILLVLSLVLFIYNIFQYSVKTSVADSWYEPITVNMKAISLVPMPGGKYSGTIHGVYEADNGTRIDRSLSPASVTQFVPGNYYKIETKKIEIEPNKYISTMNVERSDNIFGIFVFLLWMIISSMFFFIEE